MYQPFVTRLDAPSSSSQFSQSTTYDYSGLDEHLKRQEELGGLRDVKFGALYGGDVTKAVSGGNRIRDLLSAVRVHAPDATERSPQQLVNPLVRVTSTSTSGGSQADGGSAHFERPTFPQFPAPVSVAGGTPKMPTAPRERRQAARDSNANAVKPSDRRRQRNTIGASGIGLPERNASTDIQVA